MASRDDPHDVDSDEEYEEVGGDVGAPPAPAPSAGAQQQQQQQQQQPAATPSGIPGLPARPAGGLGSLPPRGLTGGLPTRPGAAPTQAASTPPSAGAASGGSGGAASTSSPAAPSPSSGAGAGPSLPARPAGGLGALPPRGLGAGLAPKTTSPQPASSAGSTSASSAPQQQPVHQPQPPGASASPASAAAPSTGGLPSLPARPTPAPTPAAAPAGLGVRPAGLGGATGLGGAGLSRAPGAPAAVAVAPAARGPPPPAPSSGASALSSAAVQAAAALQARPAQPSESVVDPSEERKGARIQAKVQEARVQLVRAAGRLGLRYDSEQVQQFMGVINRVEQVAGAAVYKGAGRRVDLAREAERTARQLDSQEAPDSKLGIKVKVLLLGISGTGKSELINSLLERPASRTHAFRESTKRVKVVRGTVQGIQMELIDTPGLHASATNSAENRSILKAIRAAYKWHKPNYVFWVDRLDSGRSALGELSLLGQVNEVLGTTVWRETMVLLTHAHSCRAAMGTAYETFGRQRRNIISQLLRQAAGNQQVRNPMFLVDSHPSCPTNSFGQPIIFEGATAVPWKQALMLQLVGYRLYEAVQALFRDGSKAKAAAAAGKQADMFKQMMRPRLPPVSFYVEQLCEGVLAPEGWAAMEDPQDAGTEDLEAEEFEHAYYRTMYDLSCQGNPWAQKEYATMLAKQDRIRSTYRDAFKNEDVEQLAAAGYEGYVAEGLDLGPTFDPMQGTNHRYVYAVPEADWQIMPTLDYYGFEHEDAISGFVAEWEGQPFNRHGWGGMPLNVHLAVEKDKTSTCLQGEVHASVVHTVPPWGSRHITQLVGAFEVLRPNIKDVLYQLEVNTFKDGFLRDNDHAGVGLMVSRLGENGKVTKGPMGLGLRLQDTLRVGAFKVEGCAAKVTAETAQGGRDEAWGGRAFVRYDYLPGVGMLFDFYQQRTKDTDQFNVMGTAANFTYDFAVAGCACGLEVDWVPGHEQLHVDLNVFSGSNYKPAWLLLVPAVNYLRGLWQSWRQGAGGEGAEEGEYADEAEEGEEGASGLTPEQQAQLQLQQMMRMMGMGGR